MTRDAYQPVGLSVVMPVRNGQGWIGRSLRHLGSALDVAATDRVEVLVIDDGSTDGTVEEVEASWGQQERRPLTVLSQQNAGRFAARRRGLEQAQYPFVLFLDTRVFLHAESLAFVLPLLLDPQRQVWTAHVQAATEDNHLAGFWQAIEHVAWRRYFAEPRDTCFGLEDFDYYPKGTTALIAPRDLMLEAFDAFEPTVADWGKVNDDTAVLRWVAGKTPINISPLYACTYNARAELRAFLQHAEHRGTVLIDGYLRPGARFSKAIPAVLAASPLLATAAVLRPHRAISAAAIGAVSAGAASWALGARRQDATVLALYSVPFGVAYTLGMWRGVGLRLKAMSGRS